ncbi:MAG: HlyC/CorC family transporter [Verrucomicrobia bacterium]|nr:HlyC/CorC family transporter [Verrucomicrobiota bacterium]
MALVAASFFFALAESALFSLGTWRARRLVESGRRGSERVGALLAQPADVIAAIALGNTLANALLVAMTVTASLELDRGIPGLGWAALGLSLLLLGCEVTPKALGVRSPESWALRVAEPLWLFVSLTRPVRRVAQACVDAIVERLVPRSTKAQAGVSDDEYADLIELAHQQGTLGAGEKEILLQVLSLDQRTAGDVMQPRARMVLLPDDLPMDRMVAEARRSGHHWIPLYDETPDNVVGVLNTRTLLLDPSPTPDLFMAMEFPSFIPESMNLLKLFESMQRQHRGVAIVLDEYGGTAGLLTLQDILASVVGPIRREGEARGFVFERIAPGRWRVHGAMRVEDFRREHPALNPPGDVETMAGLVLWLADVVPGTGEVFRCQGLRITVRAADERRIRELLVETEAPA